LKRRLIGALLLAFGLGAIAAGIVLKRMFAMGQYLFSLHVTGGLLLAVGISMLSLGGEKVEHQNTERK
jgi:hypothetical protein